MSVSTPTNWLAGVTAVYTSLFGVGKLIFGDWVAAASFLGIALLAFLWIARNLSRIEPDRTEAAPPPGAPHEPLEPLEATPAGD